MTTSFVARNPTDLIAITPYVLGFRPEDSVVLLTFGARPFHARVDLPKDPRGRREVSRLLTTAAQRNGAEKAAVLVFTPDDRAARAQGRALVKDLCAAGVNVIDVLRVESKRYFFCLAGDREGTAYDVRGHPFSAQQVYEGNVVHESREALAKTLVGTDRAATAAVRTAVTDCPDLTRAEPGPRLRAEALWLQGAVRHAVRTRSLPTPVEAARMLTLCRSGRLRDVAMAEMDRRRAQQHVWLWRELVRCAPDELVPPAAALLAFAGWLAGDGALAWCALDRCLGVDPAYSLAETIAGLLMSATPPGEWEGLHPRDLVALSG